MFSFNTKNRKYTHNKSSHNKSSHDKAKKSIGNSDVIGAPSRLEIGTQKVPRVPMSTTIVQPNSNHSFPKSFIEIEVNSRKIWKKNGTFGKIVDVWKFGFSRFFCCLFDQNYQKKFYQCEFCSISYRTVDTRTTYFTARISSEWSSKTNFHRDAK